MRKIINVVAIVGLLVGAEAQASPGQILRMFSDIKLPSQKVLEAETLTSPAAQGTTRNLLSVDGPSSAAAATVSTFSAQPDVPRNLILTPDVGPGGSNSNTVEGCRVVVSGTDYRGQSISEDFSVSDNSLAAVTGNFAFKSVTSVAFAANCEASPYGIRWNLGSGVKFGLKGCLGGPGDLAWSTSGGIFDSTRATVATNGSTSVRASTIQFNAAPNGIQSYKAYYIQNYACP